MQVKILDQRHPTYDKDEWRQLEALSEGGKKFKAHLSDFLPRNPGEPVPTYIERMKRAHFKSYIAAIVSLYTSWLFSADYTTKTYRRGSSGDPIEKDKFFGEFEEDVTGNEQTLKSFVQDRFRETLRTGKSYWLAEKPPLADGETLPATRQEFEDRGLGRITLKAIDRCELINWACDDHGKLIWACTYTVTDPAQGPFEQRGVEVEEIWRVYDRENVQTFKWRYREDKKPPRERAVAIGDTPRAHGFSRVPIICLSVPEELCIGVQTKAPQLEHFQTNSALFWALNRTAYAMPVVNIESDEKFQQTMGVGYFIQLGKDDKFSWASPPAESFEVLRKAKDDARNEIYRITHQMAQSVDNNAETVGRSAASKEIDAAATRIVLNAYGGFVREALEETLEIVSEGRGDKDTEWSVEGFSGFDTATVASLISQAKEARLLGIPSETFQKELTTKVAMAMITEIDTKVKDQIRAEIQKTKFRVSDLPMDLETSELDAAKAEFERAKAEAEPKKVRVAEKAASRPVAAPRPVAKSDSGQSPKPDSK